MKLPVDHSTLPPHAASASAAGFAFASDAAFASASAFELRSAVEPSEAPISLGMAPIVLAAVPPCEHLEVRTHAHVLRLGCGLGLGVGVGLGLEVGFGFGLAARVGKHLAPWEHPHVVGAEGGGTTDGEAEEGDTEQYAE